MRKSTKGMKLLTRGSRPVDREALASVPTPNPTGTWSPVAHEEVISTVIQALEAAGYVVQASRFYMMRQRDARMLAILDFADPLVDGVTLAVGVRNSLDKSLRIGFIAGSRVGCCQNLAFRSDLMVAEKHTPFGAARFIDEIGVAVSSLDAFKREESGRIEGLRNRTLSDEAAESILLRAYESRIVAQLLHRVIREWRKPSLPDWEPRTAWSLYNAFTTVLGTRFVTNPEKYVLNTIKLGALFNTGQRRRRGSR